MRGRDTPLDSGNRPDTFQILFLFCVSRNVCSGKVADDQTKESTGSNIVHQVLNLENAWTRGKSQVIQEAFACRQA